MPKTTMDALYSAIGAVVQRATGRSWWRKQGIQAQPSGPYATVYLIMGQGVQIPIVEEYEYPVELETGETFKEIPWGTRTIDCQVEFIRSSGTNTALSAAVRFENALRLDARHQDLWAICAPAGATRLIDISAMFRADIESRVRVEFRIHANVTEPDPLADVSIHNIEKQPILITEVVAEDVENQIDIAVDKDGGVTPWPTT